MSTEIERLQVHLTGRVQNVGFRAFALEQARRQLVTGWVRNLAYDEIEMTAEGPRPALEAFLLAVHSGPRGARVDEARVEWLAGTGEFQRFEMRSSR